MRPRDKVGVLVDSDWTRWGREEWVSINVRGSCSGSTGWGGITRLCRARLTRSERTGSRVRLECESRSRGIQLLGWSRSIASLAGGESDILPGSRRNGYNCRLGFTSEWRNSLDSHVRKPLCSRRLGSRGNGRFRRFEGIGLGFNDGLGGLGLDLFLLVRVVGQDRQHVFWDWQRDLLSAPILEIRKEGLTLKVSLNFLSSANCRSRTVFFSSWRNRSADPMRPSYLSVLASELRNETYLCSSRLGCRSTRSVGGSSSLVCGRRLGRSSSRGSDSTRFSTGTSRRTS
jgi:hypothetical protein